MNKKQLYGLIGLAAVALLSASAWAMLKKGAWVCQDGQWQKRGLVLTAVPRQVCIEEGQVLAPRQSNTAPATDAELIVKQPGLNGDISTGQAISGFALGTWYFEGSFPIQAIKPDGQVIGQCVAQAVGDWMTEAPVAFNCQLELTADYAGKGFLLFKNSNPSGLPEKDKQYRYPVVFVAADSQIVQVFFTNAVLSSGESACSSVGAIERAVAKTEAPARAALEALLAGPTQAELAGGWQTAINSGVKIVKLSIKDGLASLELSPELEKNLGGSCRVAAIRAQLEATLKQFETVRQVQISVSGKTPAESLQP